TALQLLDYPGVRELAKCQVYAAVGHPGPADHLSIRQRIRCPPKNPQGGPLAASPENRGQRLVNPSDDRLFRHKYKVGCCLLYTTASKKRWNTRPIIRDPRCAHRRSL